MDKGVPLFCTHCDTKAWLRIDEQLDFFGFNLFRGASVGKIFSKKTPFFCLKCGSKKVELLKSYDYQSLEKWKA